MKIIGMLLALLMVGWLLYGQLALMPPTLDVVSHQENATPRVPTTLQQLDVFDQEINQFVTESAAERARQIEQNQ